MGAHSGERRWFGLWTHTGRHSDSPVLETESEYPEPAPLSDEYMARHADRIHTDPVTEILPSHRHRRSRIWGSVVLAAAVATGLVAAVIIVSTHPDTRPTGQGPAAVLPSPHDEPSEDPLGDPEPDSQPPAAGAPSETPQREEPSPTAAQSPAGTATVTVTPSGQAPAPVRPSGPVPTVTKTVTQPAAPYAPEPQPTVTVTRTVRATETRYLPRPRVTVTITVSVPSLLP